MNARPPQQCAQLGIRLDQAALELARIVDEIAAQPISERDAWLFTPAAALIGRACETLAQLEYEAETTGQYDGLDRRPPIPSISGAPQ